MKIPRKSENSCQCPTRGPLGRLARCAFLRADWVITDPCARRVSGAYKCGPRHSCTATSEVRRVVTAVENGFLRRRRTSRGAIPGYCLGDRPRRRWSAASCQTHRHARPPRRSTFSSQRTANGCRIVFVRTRASPLISRGVGHRLAQRRSLHTTRYHSLSISRASVRAWQVSIPPRTSHGPLYWPAAGRWFAELQGCGGWRDWGWRRRSRSRPLHRLLPALSPQYISWWTEV